MKEINIVGYETDCNCEHCGRHLKHGVRISDGRVVGATCLDKKITQPKVYQGKKYRLGAEKIINAAKVSQFISPDQWLRYGVNTETLRFQAI